MPVMSVSDLLPIFISFTARIFSKFSGVNLTVPSVSFVHPMFNCFSTASIKGRLLMTPSTTTVHSALCVPSAVVTVTVASPLPWAVTVQVPSLLSCIVTTCSGVTLHVTFLSVAFSGCTVAFSVVFCPSGRGRILLSRVMPVTAMGFSGSVPGSVPSPGWLGGVTGGGGNCWLITGCYQCQNQHHCR